MLLNEGHVPFLISGGAQMTYLTEDKLAILGSAGAIGSNMVQASLAMGLTPNVAMYDPYDKGNQGAAEEIFQCAFPGCASDLDLEHRGSLEWCFLHRFLGRRSAQGRHDPRRPAQRKCRDCRTARQRHQVVLSQRKARSDHLQPGGHHRTRHLGPLGTGTQQGCYVGRIWIALDFKPLSVNTSVCPRKTSPNCRTYGGHGEMMAVFASTARVGGRPLSDLIGTPELSEEAWQEIQAHVRQGGKTIIQLRGRSSFQSPSHHSIRMIKAAIEGGGFEWPSGTYVDSPDNGFQNALMAMETEIGVRRCELEDAPGHRRGDSCAARLL